MRHVCVHVRCPTCRGQNITCSVSPHPCTFFRLSRLCFPSHCRDPGVWDAHYCVQPYMHTGDLNLGLCEYVECALLIDWTPQPGVHVLMKCRGGHEEMALNFLPLTIDLIHTDKHTVSFWGFKKSNDLIFVELSFKVYFYLLLYSNKLEHVSFVSFPEVVCLSDCIKSLMFLLYSLQMYFYSQDII